MRILVDMDGVLANFEKGFLNALRALSPEGYFIPLEERSTFYILDQYPREFSRRIQDILHAANFIRDLEPIDGGVKALEEMDSMGIEVFICTSPLNAYQNSVLEKYLWVERHLGRRWTRRIILTRDKTIVLGDILIDDRPAITGAELPRWEHVLYDQPFNRNASGLRRLTWQNWKEVIGL